MDDDCEEEGPGGEAAKGWSGLVESMVFCSKAMREPKVVKARACRA